jgi:hypothetical protein
MSRAIEHDVSSTVRSVSVRALSIASFWFFLNLRNEIIIIIIFQIHFTIALLYFHTPLKYYFFTKYKFSTYPYLFLKNSNIFPNKRKRDEREIFFIKIMKWETKVLPNKLGSIVDYPIFGKGIGHVAF